MYILLAHYKYFITLICHYCIILSESSIPRLRLAIQICKTPLSVQQAHKATTW